MSTEIAVVFSWLESTLSGDATLQGLAPGGVLQTFPLPGTTSPFTVVRHQSGGADYVVFGGNRAYSDMRFQVVVAGPFANMQTIWNAAARIDSLITVKQLSVTGGTILACFREQSVSNEEYVDSAKWSVVGGEYHIMALGS